MDKLMANRVRCSYLTDIAYALEDCLNALLGLGNDEATYKSKMVALMEKVDILINFEKIGFLKTDTI